ncbi:hypothetical protein BX600DRAFT_193846 [Xylariales sp. PMI_506]|nr:hypothetical protein BX600DRAFT_193846 [Xylariales sp. PMI_506]
MSNVTFQLYLLVPSIQCDVMVDRHFTPQQEREFKKRRLDGERVRALMDMVANIPRDIDQEEYENQRTILTSSDVMNTENSHSCPARQIESSTDQGVVKQDDTDHLRWARVHNPWTDQVYDVEVTEDTGTGVNFINPKLARDWDLEVYTTAPTFYQLITGSQFKADKWVEVQWIGKQGKTGSDWFYLVPEGTPIQLLVGRRFLKEHNDVFMKEKPESEPVLVNVQSKKKKSERDQIAADRARADAQAAALEKLKKDKKKEKTEHSKDQASSSGSRQGKKR